MYTPEMTPRGPVDDRNYFTIQFKHIPTGRKTSFEGWVTTFSDNFSSQWNEIPVYGRMDPLATFTRTSRKIQLAFDVPSANLGAAQTNLQAVNDLITFLYPVYEKQDGSGNQRVGHTLKAAPLIELKWTNLIADASDNSGLIGYLDGVNYAPKIEEGGFGRAAGGNYISGMEGGFDALTSMSPDEFASIQNTHAGAVGDRMERDLPHGLTIGDPDWGSVNKADIYIPKTLSISLNFTVLHKHLPGWITSIMPDEYVFGNQQVGDGFPNTQVDRRTLATSQGITETRLNERGEEIATQVTQITSALGSEVLVGNGNI